jgi:hypothetical protein
MELLSKDIDLEALRNINNHRMVIDGLVQNAISGNNHTLKREFEDPFNFHLSELNSFIIKDNVVHKKFSKAKTFVKEDYKFIESFIFHNSSLLELNKPVDFDENSLLNITDYFYEKIKTVLSKEELNSEQYKYFVNTTYSVLDSFYQYELMHPKSHFNPWSDIFVLCTQGYFLLCENKSDLKGLIDSDALRKIVSEKGGVSNNNMGVLAKGQLKSNKLSGFIMDERFSLQNVLYDILNTKAQGYNRALNSKKIVKELANHPSLGRSFRKEFISNILNSMKKAGIIGSSTKGFFTFHSNEDIQKSIDFHQSIVDGFNKTIRVLGSRLK